MKPERTVSRTVGILLSMLASAACIVAAEGTHPSEGLVELQGTELFYQRMGSGEPLFVVHGGPLLEHGYLLPHLAPLGEDYELVFADQRLSGRSAGSAPPESVRLATLVDDIEGLRRQLGLGRIHLLAHSWGGLLATRYALEYPANLRSLILVSPMAASSELWRQEQQAVAVRLTPEDDAAMREVRESKAFAEERPEAIERLLRLSFRAQFHDPERVADLQLYVPDDQMARSRRFTAMMVDLASYDLHERLGEISIPTLILYGEDEPGGTLGGAALGEGIPHSRLLTLESAGHFSFIEQPAKFLRLTREFLSSVGAPGIQSPAEGPPG